VYPFGQDIAYKIYTGVNGEALTGIPSSQGTSGKLYLYATRPTRDDALLGTGALAGAYNITVASNVLSATITAIADPDTESETRSVTYYIAANFIKKSGGQEETIIRPIKLIRVDAHDVNVGIDTDTIIEKMPDIVGYLENTQIAGMISIAQRFVKDELGNKGIEWASLHEPSQLYWSVLWKTFEYVNESQTIKAGDRWDKGREIASKHYQSAMSVLRPLIESNANGVATAAPQIKGYIILER